MQRGCLGFETLRSELTTIEKGLAKVSQLVPIGRRGDLPLPPAHRDLGVEDVPHGEHAKGEDDEEANADPLLALEERVDHIFVVTAREKGCGLKVVGFCHICGLFCGYFLATVKTAVKSTCHTTTSLKYQQATNSNDLNCTFFLFHNYHIVKLLEFETQVLQRENWER